MPRPFLDFLREHRGGATHGELTDALAELVRQVGEQGRGGTLTLTISLKPAGRDAGVLEVGAEVRSKAPKSAPGVAIFYATPEHALVRQDPRQEALALREVTPNPHRSLA